MKIAILGLSGSGKTTLAKKLANLYHLEHLNLDYVIYKPIEGSHKRTKIAEEEYSKVINEFARRKAWVIEGVFLFNQVLEKADQIIWIKPSLTTSLIRQWKRYFTDPIQRKEHSLKSNFRNSKTTVKLHFDKEGKALDNLTRLHSIKETEDVLAKHKKILTILKNNNEIDNYLKNLIS